MMNFPKNSNELKDVQCPALGTLAKSPAARAQRYELQRKSSLASPSHRVSKCCRVPTSGGGVAIMKHESGSLSFSGVQTCGSVWECPVCSGKISSGRHKELDNALHAWVAKGGKFCLVTSTIRHGKGDNLKELLQKLAKARSSKFGSRAVRRWKYDVGIVGSVRSLEVTYGVNGFHPHIHEIYFYKGEFTESDRIFLARSWQSACIRVGLAAPDLDIGVHVDFFNPSMMSQYVTKWGMSCEITKGSYKNGSGTSRNMWTVLDDSSSDEKSLDIWRIYVEAMKGQRQVFWSRGLKALLLVKDKTDDDLLEDGKDAKEIFRISDIDWQVLIAYGSRDKLLSYDNKDYFQKYIDSLWFDAGGEIPSHPYRLLS